MKRYGWKTNADSAIQLIESEHGELCFYKDAIRQQLDKTAALMALMQYWIEADTHENKLRCGAAIHKLAAAIIAEVEAGE